MGQSIAQLVEELSDLMVRQGDDPVTIAGAVSDNVINEIEHKLGVKFPDDYRLFLKAFGAISIADAQFFGIWDKAGNSTSGATVLGETFRLRESASLPHDFVPFHNPIYDLYVCLNCSPIKVEREIVYFDSSQGIYECKHANTFTEFVENYLKGYIEANS